MDTNGACPYDLMRIYTRSGKKITHFDRVTDLMVRGVHIVTTSYEDKCYGLAAAWAMRISGSPYLIMTAVWHQSYTHSFIGKAQRFAVNILEEGQADIARHFGRQTGREVDKFKRQDIYWETRTTGAPILLDALAYLDCRLVDAYDPPNGDHTLFIGEIVDADQLREGKALVFRRSDYPYRVLNLQE
jgi:flavin reductase (DIM6/NTAB) family NADH-FMN oxidoreductase RutF